MHTGGNPKKTGGKRMSTRCQIGIYENEDEELLNPEVMLYKHFDGYPQEMMPLLVDHMKGEDNQRNIGDAEYFSAWLLYDLIDAYVTYAKKKDYEIERLGFGICGDKLFHADTEYYYAVYPECIKVYSVGGTDKDLELINVKHLKEDPKPEPEPEEEGNFIYKVVEHGFDMGSRDRVIGYFATKEGAEKCFEEHNLKGYGEIYKKKLEE